MKILYLVILMLSFASATNFTQTPSPTPPAPLTELEQSNVKKADEIPVKLSKPLYETKTAVRHIIVSARSSRIKEFASLGSRLEVYVRDRVPQDTALNEDNKSFVFLIDGESFPASQVLSDKTINFADNNDGSVIYTRTYLLDIPVDRIKRVQSITVLWSEENISVPVEGLNTLLKFVGETMKVSER